MGSNFLVDGLYDELMDIEFSDKESGRRLDPHIKPAKNRLGRYFREELGLPPYTGGVSFEVAPLDAYFVFDRDAGRTYIFKVFGSYDPKTRKITIDPVVLDKESPQRRELEKHGLNVPGAQEVITHELVHATQYGLGVMCDAYSKFGPKSARDYLEGAAQDTTNRILGIESDLYRTEAKRHRTRSGGRSREAFLIPCI